MKFLENKEALIELLQIEFIYFILAFGFKVETLRASGE